MHKKDPMRKKARYEGLTWKDVSSLYPSANPGFFLLAAGLRLLPRKLLTGVLTLRDRAVRVHSVL
jgi:hypothetical protein